MLSCIGLAITTIMASINSTHASETGVHFGGDVTNNAFCIIFVNQPGTLAPNIGSTQLSSKLPGGSAGTAEVWSFRRYEVSVSSPTYFDTYPTGGDIGVNFTTTFSGRTLRRGRNFAERPGDSPIRTRRGFSRTEITVNLTADKADGFPSGDYSAHTVLRCE